MCVCSCGCVLVSVCTGTRVPPWSAFPRSSPHLIMSFLNGDQVVLEVTEIHLCPPPKWWNRSVCHHIGPPCSLRQGLSLAQSLPSKNSRDSSLSLPPQCEIPSSATTISYVGPRAQVQLTQQAFHWPSELSSPCCIVFIKMIIRKKIYSTDFWYASYGKKTKLGLYISILLLVSLTN